MEIACSRSRNKDSKNQQTPYVSPSPGELWPFLSSHCRLVFGFPFLEWEIRTKFGRDPFCCPQVSCLMSSAAPGRLRPFGELDATLHPPLGSDQPNAALDFIVSRPMCVFLRFLGGAPGASRPLGYMALIVDHVWLRSR